MVNLQIKQEKDRNLLETCEQATPILKNEWKQHLNRFLLWRRHISSEIAMGKAGVALSVLLDSGRIGLSVYSLYVKQMVNSSPDYKAHCDVSSYITCSKTFNSSYGTGFGLIGPLLGEDHVLNQNNGVYGVIFFLMHLLLVCFAASKFGLCLRLLNSVVLAAGSAWLAYVLFFVLQHMCPVCVTIYGLNLLALLLDYCQLRGYSVKQQRSAVKADKRKKK